METCAGQLLHEYCIYIFVSTSISMHYNKYFMGHRVVVWVKESAN